MNGRTYRELLNNIPRDGIYAKYTIHPDINEKGREVAYKCTVTFNGKSITGQYKLSKNDAREDAAKEWYQHFIEGKPRSGSLVPERSPSPELLPEIVFDIPLHIYIDVENASIVCDRHSQFPKFRDFLSRAINIHVYVYHSELFGGKDTCRKNCEPYENVEIKMTRTGQKDGADVYMIVDFTEGIESRKDDFHVFISGDRIFYALLDVYKEKHPSVKIYRSSDFQEHEIIEWVKSNSVDA